MCCFRGDTAIFPRRRIPRAALACGRIVARHDEKGGGDADPFRMPATLGLQPIDADPAPTPAACSADAAHSRFVQRVRRRYAGLLPLLADGLPRRDDVAGLVARLQTDGRPLASALRVSRQLVLERLAVLDVEHGAPMADMALAMTELAEATLDIALRHARAELDARHGELRNAAGDAIDFWIVGMGKLGGRELNVSSDIDLVYVYADDGESAGGQPLGAQEYFAKLARSLHALIGETTDDGFVFRVDLMLRPNGSAGPPAVSLAMLEEYLQVQGREWERFAWLKSRVVAPRASLTSRSAIGLRAAVTPFVYRRDLDYGVFEALRQLHRKVRDEAQRRAAGRPERANDVKLSRGGIREIEFIVQLLLVVRGGQFPEIRSRSTLAGLRRLAAGGLMAREVAARLAEAYIFLRRVEHRIQYLDDQQTHLLPTADADLRWISRSLGLACEDDNCPLLALLGETREYVATEFDALLHEGQAPRAGVAPTVDDDDPAAKAGCRSCGGPPPSIGSEAFAERLPPELAARIAPWANHPKVLALREDSRQRLGRLVERAARAVEESRCTVEAAGRFIDWLEPLFRRESYLALLAERPEVQKRLLRLLGLAVWPMRYLMRHPGVIDELADERLLHDRFEPVAFIDELEARHRAWQRSGQADEEALLDALRRAHHAEVFRTLVRDVEGHISVEQVADDLSALADATLDCVLRWCWQHLKLAHRAQPRFAVIAYGKLGSKELGYGSDLDLVFLYATDATAGGDADREVEAYTAFARKLVQWLTLRTAAGALFDIDTALRPNGNAGLLVASMASFEKYQAGRGSNTAWTWEHQALTRARFCSGDAALAPAFETVRRAVLAVPRDAASLRTEIVAMRERVRAAHPAASGRFDVKHGAGGMIDVEFAVQFLVLANSASHAGLLDNVGNIALLERAEAAGLLGTGIGRGAADAYRELRRVQHRARLDERPTQVEPQDVAASREAVLALWKALFEPTG